MGIETHTRTRWKKIKETIGRENVRVIEDVCDAAQTLFRCSDPENERAEAYELHNLRTRIHETQDTFPGRLNSLAAAHFAISGIIREAGEKPHSYPKLFLENAALDFLKSETEEIRKLPREQFVPERLAEFRGNFGNIIHKTKPMKIDGIYSAQSCAALERAVFHNFNTLWGIFSQKSAGQPDAQTEGVIIGKDYVSREDLTLLRFNIEKSLNLIKSEAARLHENSRARANGCQIS